MPAPWLSILIPVYNVAPWLEACLESVLQQAGADIEIIALDDASSDNSAAVLANYHPRVQCLQHTHNRGLSAARNGYLVTSIITAAAILFMAISSFITTSSNTPLTRKTKAICAVMVFFRKA